MEKVCAILAPKLVRLSDDVKNDIENCIKTLIFEKKVTTFLFEPQSNFGIICFKIVTQLKKDYPHIQRICYTSKNEYCVLDNNNVHYTLQSSCSNSELICYDKEIHYENKYITGNFSLIERNWKMIDESDIILFYYDEKSSANTKELHKFNPIKQPFKTNIGYAYKYALSKNKMIINLHN